MELWRKPARAEACQRTRPLLRSITKIRQLAERLSLSGLTPSSFLISAVTSALGSASRPPDTSLRTFVSTVGSEPPIRYSPATDRQVQSEVSPGTGNSETILPVAGSSRTHFFFQAT